MNEITNDNNSHKKMYEFNLYKLAGLGLVFSLWTHYMFLTIIDLRPKYWRHSNDQFQMTILNTLSISYFTTAVGLIWGFYISELRYFKLWGCVKLVEMIVNILSVIGAIAKGLQYFPIVILISVFGIYVMISIREIYKHLLEQNEENKNEEKSSVLNLQPYDICTNIPSVHIK